MGGQGGHYYAKHGQSERASDAPAALFCCNQRGSAST